MKQYPVTDFRFGMDYEPKPEDPVLIYKNLDIGFNPLNRKAVDGFFENVRKAAELAEYLGIANRKEPED